MSGFLVHSPVEHFALKTPEQPALSFQGDELNYRELDLRSNQLANALIANKAIAEDRVGIYMYKSLELGVAIYGALKAGCVFVPLDPFMPLDRLAFILSDCEIHHVISSNDFSSTLAGIDVEHSLTLYGINDHPTFRCFDWQEIYQYSDNAPDIPVIDQDLAYIMYTSGSTGVPKGMMHTHHGSVSYARWGVQHVGLQTTDRVASHAPLHFDLSIFDFFSTAQAGATVVLVPEPVTRFPASWTKLVDSERITVVFTVPFTLISMLEQGVMEQRQLTSLRWILYGGEPFPPNRLRQFMLALPDVKLTNVYGPAEAPSCTCYDVPLPSEGDMDAIPIGTVSRNSADLIVDENDQDCAQGAAGELCIRSSTLTRGYWNRPDLDASAYLFRPGYGQFPHVYFRTGDMVIRQADGLLQFLGRVDRMVKIRGQRVELDEVELVLANHDAVSEAAAFVVPDDFDSQRIIAAVTVQIESGTDPGELLRHARGKLPMYAVPGHIEIMLEMPHNSSGKIDRKLLTEQWISDNG